MSSPFQKSFSAKSPMSPLNGAYASGSDGMVAQSDRAAFDKLTSDITSATLATFTPEAMDEDLEKRIAKRKGRISKIPDLRGGADVEMYTPSKVAQFFGAEKTLDPTKIKKKQAKTTKLEERLAKRKTNRTASTQEKLTSNCIDKAGGYIGYDPDLNNGKGGCYK